MILQEHSEYLSAFEVPSQFNEESKTIVGQSQFMGITTSAFGSISQFSATSNLQQLDQKVNARFRDLDDLDLSLNRVRGEIESLTEELR